MGWPLGFAIQQFPACIPLRTVALVWSVGEGSTVRGMLVGGRRSKWDTERQGNRMSMKSLCGAGMLASSLAVVLMAGCPQTQSGSATTAPVEQDANTQDSTTTGDVATNGTDDA